MQKMRNSQHYQGIAMNVLQLQSKTHTLEREREENTITTLKVDKYPKDTKINSVTKQNQIRNISNQ